ncbi:hypothetical protein A3D09_01510, partial [Candidatus Collierbacteria bacterium RIFCSPHIGHO2_02_FULL_49_10]
KSVLLSDGGVFPRKPLVTKLLLIEGISRSGKFLLSDLLAGFDGVEPVQTHVGVDHIPILTTFGLIEKAAAKEFLRCEIDVYCYEALIGRFLNHRKTDKSSIFKHPRYKEFLARADVLDPQVLVQKFIESGTYSLFIVHELMQHINLYFETFPQMKMLYLTRSPIDLVASWYQRGYGGDRIAKDPTFFMIPFSGKNGPVPWYALEFKDEFYRMTPMDRIIRSVEWFFVRNERAYQALPTKYRRRIIFVSFEELMIRPLEAVAKLEKFLSKKALPVIRQILRREKLPNPGRLFEKQQKLKIIKKLASPKYYRGLLQLEGNYQKSLGKELRT